MYLDIFGDLRTSLEFPWMILDVYFAVIFNL